MTITDLYRQLFGRKGIEDGNVIEMAEHGRVGGVSTGQPFKYVAPIDPDTGTTLTGGAGTQYTEGDTDTTITGTAVLWEDTSDTLRAVSATKPLPVNIISGAGSGGTASADDADFTAGTTSGTPAMGVYESTPTNVTDGDLGVVGITTGRRLKTSATVDAALPAGDNNIGNVDIVSSALPTGAATSANQTTIIGHLDGVEGLLTTIDADTGNVSTKIDTIAGAVSGTEMQVDIVSAPTLTVNAHNVTNAGTFAVQESGSALTALQLIDDTVATTASAITGKGIAVSGTDGTNARILKTDTSGELQVDVLTMPTTTVQATNLDIRDLTSVSDSVAAVQSGTWNVTVNSALPSGTNAIGKLSANSGVDIGDVDVTSLPALAAGTNAIGKLIPPDYDVTSHTAKAVKYYTNAGAVTDGIIWSPAAGKRWHVTTLFINVSAAATVTLEDDLAGGDSAVMKMELAANSGVAIPFGDMYPLTSGEDAADLLITTSAGNVYVTAVGYEI